LGCILDSLDNPNMGAAPAEVFIHCMDNVIPGRFRAGGQETVRLENHTGGAEPALKRIVPDKGLLDGVKPAVLFKSFDGGDGFALDIPRRHLTRPDRLAVNKNRAGSAQALAAAVFRPGKTKIGP
jgi:hypothetical protein